MSTTTTIPPASGTRARALLNKVPEVTIWFWIIKILCTTVGESFADWIAVDLGVGLINTTIIFTVVLAAVLTWQIRLPRYNPFSYWLAVVVLSVTGTLYTDILTDRYGVNLAITTPIVAALLAAVFAVWYAKEHTLSIHSIFTTRREAFYWAAALVTFALGTAVGDLTAVTLHLGYLSSGILFGVAFGLAGVAYRWFRLNGIAAFWWAYIATRPFGASFADWFAKPVSAGGLGYGQGIVSLVLAVVIVVSVSYLTVTRVDDPNDESLPLEAASPSS